MLGIDDIRFEADPVASRHDQAATGTFGSNLVFDSDWCSVHHIKPGTTPHRVSMERSTHTLLVFDGGSFSEGERRINGARLAGGGALDTGIDVMPVGSRLVACSGAVSDIGCTLVTLDALRLGDLVGTPNAPASELALRAELGMRNDLLSPLVTRLRRWSMVDEDNADMMQRETILMLIVQEIVRLQNAAAGLAGSTHRGGLSSRAQRLIREYVAEHLDTRIELQTLADEVGLSRFHFSRAFKVSFGLPPHKYVMGERVRVAAQKIRSSNDSITDIALQVGFSCSSELTRLFRQTIGCTPREYRTLGLSHREEPV